MSGIRSRQNPVWVPGARKVSGPYSGGPAKALFHATITGSMTLPGYANQTMAPHETMLWNPSTRVMVPRTHYYFDNYAKALSNKSGGVQTNKDTVLQWELAGDLNNSAGRGYFNILDAPATYWEQLAHLTGPAIVSWGVKRIVPARGFAGASARMGMSEWDNFNGLCVHNNVPENSHWDLPIPGAALAILLDKIWPSATKPPVTTPIAPYSYKPFPLPAGHDYGRYNARDKTMHSGIDSATDRANIRRWQEACRKYHGSLIKADGLFGPYSEGVARAIQKRKGIRVDGIVGPTTWRVTWGK